MIGEIIHASKFVRNREKIINFDKEAVSVAREINKYFATCPEEARFIRANIKYLREIVKHNEAIRKQV